MIILWDSCQFSAKKLAFFSKPNVMIQFLLKLAVVWAKNANIFRQKYFFNHNIGPWLFYFFVSEKPEVSQTRGGTQDVGRCSFPSGKGFLSRKRSERHKDASRKSEDPPKKLFFILFLVFPFLLCWGEKDSVAKRIWLFWFFFSFPYCRRERVCDRRKWDDCTAKTAPSSSGRRRRIFFIVFLVTFLSAPKKHKSSSSGYSRKWRPRSGRAEGLVQDDSNWTRAPQSPSSAFWMLSHSWYLVNKALDWWVATLWARSLKAKLCSGTCKAQFKLAHLQTKEINVSVAERHTLCQFLDQVCFKNRASDPYIHLVEPILWSLLTITANSEAVFSYQCQTS
jgi:hypothetical protein